MGRTPRHFDNCPGLRANFNALDFSAKYWRVGTSQLNIEWITGGAHCKRTATSRERGSRRTCRQQGLVPGTQICRGVSALGACMGEFGSTRTFSGCSHPSHFAAASWTLVLRARREPSEDAARLHDLNGLAAAAGHHHGFLGGQCLGLLDSPQGSEGCSG